MSNALGVDVLVTTEIGTAVRTSDVCITCTPSQRWIVDYRDVHPGTFVAGVGADNEYKQELHPQLMVGNKVVVDILEQCATIGDLHHAIEAGVVTREDVHAELGTIVAGVKSGRTSDDEITVFDSTGTALQDLTAAALVYEKAVAGGVGQRVEFAQLGPPNP
jgi:ornithine cyclodeaminase/alanine dehydrogenase-like protein (mu-crystallin family)